MKEITDALRAEHAEVDAMVSDLAVSDWELATPAEPWTIRDQICHLAFFDEKAALSVSDPAGFIDDLNAELSGGIEAFLDGHLEKASGIPASELMSWWRDSREMMLAAFDSADPDSEIPWYGPSMKARSSAVARLMETWAHGTDIADALEIDPTPSSRLFHIAELGIKTFSWSFINRGLATPAERVRVELWSPDGQRRVWNPDATDSISGPVEDFCRVVTQRIHPSDTELEVDGETAQLWMSIAQVFAGPPGSGRPPKRSSPS